MQNKGLIWLFTILLTLTCLYQLSFTWVASQVEDDARDYANGNPELEESYLDSVSSEPVYPIFDFTYNYVKQREINLGLDLKGGMNVILEVSVEDVVKALSSNSKDPDFNQALIEANKLQRESQEDFVTLFGRAFKKIAPNKRLVGIFYTIDNKDKLSRNANNEEVLKFLREEADDAINRSFEVLRTRINMFGVAQPNIQKLEASDRILVELPGVKNKERVRQLLQGTAKLEFWETFDNQKIYPRLEQANEKLRKIKMGEELGKDTLKADTVQTSAEPDTVSQEEETVGAAADDTTDVDTTDEELSILEQIGEEEKSDKEDTTDEIEGGQDGQQSLEEFSKENPLFGVLRPAIYQKEESGEYFAGRGAVVGYASINDTAKVNEYLNKKEIKSIFPPQLEFLWAAKPYDDAEKFLQLYAIKVKNRDGRAPLEGDVIVDASQQFGQFGGNPEIQMKMNSAGAQTWKRITRENIGKSVAIALDNRIYSAPTVQGEIANGISSITGDFSIEEAQLIANILKAGKLPAPARIVQEAMVGPSLGKEAIRAGLTSFAIALVIVLLYMVFYYSTAGIASNVALLANMFFIIGVLASTTIALTLPGIAGIVLTIGMSVDANVLIYERIREEIRAGKGIRLAVADGYKNAYSSIIDANVTTLLTGMILWFFGTGPIEGFAKVLVIGILTSLFSAIFITRLIFTWRLDRKKVVKFGTKLTENAFTKLNLGFIPKRKIYYVISSLVILAGVASFATRGLNYGVDFTGGRSYVVRFENPVSTTDISGSLAEAFVTADGRKLAPEVKTFGEDNQVKVTTSYLIDSESPDADKMVENKLGEGIGQLGLDYKIMSSQKVGPTIANDIKKAAIWAVMFSLLIIFVYIVFRFQKWQFGLGALVAIFHDVLILLSAFSLLYGFLPFSLEIDQAFIAAILTVVGYSINDTVVVFDRIREYLRAFKKKDDMNVVVNNALNSTLSRTINTSLSTFFVLLMIFIFGGEVIRGFSFALLIGVAVGTYSSVCIASPVMFDLINKKEPPLKKKKAKL